MLRTALLILPLSLTSAGLAQEPYRASVEILETENSIRPPQGANNAAWAYFAAWDTVRTVEERNRLEEASYNRPAAGGRLTPEQRTILESHRAYVEGVMAASAVTTCSWGPRFELGPDALLPHLRALRQSSRVLALDARRCAEDGDTTAAAERVVAMLRVSGHAATEPFQISSLVGIAIGRLACGVTDELLEQKKVTPHTARLLLSAIAEADGPDVYQGGEAIDNERRSTLGWLRRECAGPEANVGFVRALGAMQNDPRAWMRTPQQTLFLLSFSEQRIGREIDRAEQYFEALRRAWSSASPDVALEELELEVDELQWGFAARGVSFYFRHLYRNARLVHENFVETSRKLRALISASNDASKGAEP